MLHLHSKIRKEDDGEIKEAKTSPFKIKESVADVLDLSFCPLKTIEEVCNLFLSICFHVR